MKYFILTLVLGTGSALAFANDFSSRQAEAIEAQAQWIISSVESGLLSKSDCEFFVDNLIAIKANSSMTSKALEQMGQSDSGEVITTSLDKSVCK